MNKAESSAFPLERYRREVDELRREKNELRSRSSEPAPPTVAELRQRRLLDAMPVDEAAYGGDMG